MEHVETEETECKGFHRTHNHSLDHLHHNRYDECCVRRNKINFCCRFPPLSLLPRRQPGCHDHQTFSTEAIETWIPGQISREEIQRETEFSKVLDAGILQYHDFVVRCYFSYVGYQRTERVD